MFYFSFKGQASFFFVVVVLIELSLLWARRLGYKSVFSFAAFYADFKALGWESKSQISILKSNDLTLNIRKLCYKKYSDLLKKILNHKKHNIVEKF